jgi:glycosyltransferase AglD
MTAPPDLSLILACYNETVVLEQSVREILEVLDATRLSYEVIFVDDCSQDDTRDLIDRLIERDASHDLRRVFHEANVGRGGTVVDGIQAARGEIVGFVDIDLEVHARYILSCVLAVRNGADIAVGRRHNRFRVQALPRILLSRAYVSFVKRMLGVPLDDTEAGFKFFRRERILPILDETEDRHWFWDTELMVRAHRKGYRIAEIPCLFARRFDKPSTVRVVSDTLTYFRQLWRFRRALKAQGLPQINTDKHG